jgi:hypothetical protein
VLRTAAITFAVALACGGGACKTGGEYVQGERAATDDRGETNGRMFDFVVNKPDGDEWTIRVRGNSLWVAHPHDEKTDDLGTVSLDDKETAKLWKRIDALELESRKKGKKDEATGYVLLRLREPGEDQHDIFTTYVPLDTDDEAVTSVGSLLAKLVEKYHPGVKADF